MQHRMLKVSVAGAGALIMALGFAGPALADWAPQPGDVVGVGSDTLQYAGDFVADGSYNALPGYNSALNKFAVVNFDATPDANARLAYGPNGVGTLTGLTAGSCSPGDGGTNGTGNQQVAHTDKPCTLNPTIVLQAGTKPIQRPNGSGAGAKAFAGDTADGNDFITYARASSCQDTSCSASNTLAAASYDVLKIGTDPLAMLDSTTTNAPPLSAAELAQIYQCNYHTWGDVPGFTGTTAQKAQFIVPIIPQVGSGTRSSFESAIGIADSALGSCVEVAEENDPTAIDAATDPTDDTSHVDTTSPNTVSSNAIEPMSGARLDLFNGLSGATGQALRFAKNPLVSQSSGTATGGYFQDPSCPLLAAGTFGSGGDCATATLGGVAQPNSTISTSDVQLVTTGTTPDAGGTTNGVVFNVSRNLLIYFRSNAVDVAGGWQPGTVPNAIRTLFYNPCDAFAQTQGSCVTVSSVQYGPGGQPYYATTAGQEDIAASGIAPAYEVSTTGAQNL
jgi:hypothetical protein